MEFDDRMRTLKNLPLKMVLLILLMVFVTGGLSLNQAAAGPAAGTAAAADRYSDNRDCNPDRHSADAGAHAQRDRLARAGGSTGLFAVDDAHGPGPGQH